MTKRPRLSTRDDTELRRGTCGHRGPFGRIGERGATLVEYALLVAALVVPTIATIDYVQDSAATKVAATAAGISSPTVSTTDSAPDGG